MTKILVVVLSVILLFSCSKKNDVCNYDPCAVVAPPSEVSQLESYLAGASITATKLCSGVYYVIDATGSGGSPTICSTISVKYKAQLTNGSIVDQATTATSFQLGGLIESWKQAIPLIKTGGKIRIYAPPRLAYGSEDVKDGSGNVVIPGNSILIFEVELTAVS